jgi:hypothetical protein
VEGERCFFFWARLVVSPVLSTGFPALIHTSLTDTALELTCRSQFNFFPSIPKREAVGKNATYVQTQTADINPSTDETTQTDQHNSDAQAINIPTVLTLTLYASCLCRSLPFFVNTVGMLMAWASLLCWSVCVVSSVEGLMSAVSV